MKLGLRFVIEFKDAGREALAFGGLGRDLLERFERHTDLAGLDLLHPARGDTCQALKFLARQAVCGANASDFAIEGESQRVHARTPKWGF